MLVAISRRRTDRSDFEIYESYGSGVEETYDMDPSEQAITAVTQYDDHDANDDDDDDYDDDDDDDDDCLRGGFRFRVSNFKSGSSRDVDAGYTNSRRLVKMSVDWPCQIVGFQLDGTDELKKVRTIGDDCDVTVDKNKSSSMTVVIIVIIAFVAIFAAATVHRSRRCPWQDREEPAALKLESSPRAAVRRILPGRRRGFWRRGDANRREAVERRSRIPAPPWRCDRVSPQRRGAATWIAATPWRSDMDRGNACRYQPVIQGVAPGGIQMGVVAGQPQGVVQGVVPGQPPVGQVIAAGPAVGQVVAVAGTENI